MLYCKSSLYYRGIKNAISVSRSGAKVYLFSHRGFKTTSTLQQVESNLLNHKTVSFNIRRDFNNYLVKESTLSESNVELDDIELCIDGETSLTLNLTWLRDSCHCDSCTHQYSRQRLFTVKDFRRDKFSIKDIVILPEIKVNWLHSSDLAGQSNDSCISVRWSDGHESFYSLNWLRYIHNLNRTSQFGQMNRSNIKINLPEDDLYLPTKENKPKPTYWNVETLESNLTPVIYEDLLDGFELSNDASSINANRISDMSQKRMNAMISLLKQLIRFGLAKIVNVPLERKQVLKIAKSLAYERPTGYGTVFDVVIEPSERINLAYSSLEFDIHSDLTYRETSPGVQLLHCIRDSEVGGLSYFSDALKAATLLRESDPSLFETLVQVPVTFMVRDPYRDIKLRRQQTILTLDYEGKLKDVFYSPFMLPPIGLKEDIKLFYVALDKFTKLLQSPCNKYITKMNPGELFIFHNRRVLHGRSAYVSTNMGRFLQGCYMDWDEIEGLYEKLNSYNNSFISNH